MLVVLPHTGSNVQHTWTLPMVQWGTIGVVFGQTNCKWWSTNDCPGYCDDSCCLRSRCLGRSVFQDGWSFKVLKIPLQQPAPVVVPVVSLSFFLDPRFKDLFYGVLLKLKGTQTTFHYTLSEDRFNKWQVTKPFCVVASSYVSRVWARPKIWLIHWKSK